MEVWTWGRALPWMDGGPWSGQKLPIKGIFSVHLHGGVGQHSEHFLLLLNAPRGPCVLLPGLMCLRLARGPGWRSDPGIPWKPPVKYNQSIKIKDINQRQRNIFQFCEYGGSKTWIIGLSEKFDFSLLSAVVKRIYQIVLVPQYYAVRSPWPLPPCCCHLGLGRIWASWFGA